MKHESYKVASFTGVHCKQKSGRYGETHYFIFSTAKLVTVSRKNVCRLP